MNVYDIGSSSPSDSEIIDASYSICQIMKSGVGDNVIQENLREVKRAFPGQILATQEDQLVSYFFSLMVSPEYLAKYKSKNVELKKNTERDWKLLSDVFTQGHTFRLGNQIIKLPADPNKAEALLKIGAAHCSAYCQQRLKEIAEEKNIPSSPIISVPPQSTTPTVTSPINPIRITLPSTSQKTKNLDRFHATPDDGIIIMSAYVVGKIMRPLYSEQQLDNIIQTAKNRYVHSDKVNDTDLQIQELLQGKFTPDRLRHIKKRFSKTHDNFTISVDEAFRNLEKLFLEGRTLGKTQVKIIIESDPAFAAELKKIREQQTTNGNTESSLISENTVSTEPITQEPLISVNQDVSVSSTSPTIVLSDIPSNKRKRDGDRKPPVSKDIFIKRIQFRLLRVVHNDVSQIDFPYVAKSTDSEEIKKVQLIWYRYLYDSYKALDSALKNEQEAIFDFVEDQFEGDEGIDFLSLARALSTKSHVVSAEQSKIDWQQKTWDLITSV